MVKKNAQVTLSRVACVFFFVKTESAALPNLFIFGVDPLRAVKTKFNITP